MNGVSDCEVVVVGWTECDEVDAEFCCNWNRDRNAVRGSVQG